MDEAEEGQNNSMNQWPAEARFVRPAMGRAHDHDERRRRPLLPPLLLLLLLHRDQRSRSLLYVRLRARELVPHCARGGGPNSVAPFDVVAAKWARDSSSFFALSSRPSRVESDQSEPSRQSSNHAGPAL